MSKNAKINRKRFIKLTAGQFSFQVRDLADMVMESLVNDVKREQEKAQSAAHKPTKKGGCEE